MNERPKEIELVLRCDHCGKMQSVSTNGEKCEHCLSTELTWEEKEGFSPILFSIAFHKTPEGMKPIFMNPGC